MSVATPPTAHDRPELRAAIAGFFGERSALAVRYAELLCSDGITRGLLGPREADRIWDRHIFNSVVLAREIPPGARVVDLGSGAGLPGIPIAIARPDLTVVLLEPMERRVRFLTDCLETLQLDRVEVRHGRAEAGIEPLADYVVARAIAPLDKLVRLSFELLRDNGVLLALKGATAAEELERLTRETGLAAELITVPAPGQSARVIRVIRPVRTPPSPSSKHGRKGST